MNTSTASARAVVVLSLEPGAELFPAANAELIIQTARGRLTFKQLPAGAKEALTRLGNGGANEEELETMVLQRDGRDGLAAFYHRLDQLARRGLLWRSVEDDHGPLATLTPISPFFTYPNRSVNLAQSYA